MVGNGTSACTQSLCTSSNTDRYLAARACPGAKGNADGHRRRPGKGGEPFTGDWAGITQWGCSYSESCGESVIGPFSSGPTYMMPWKVGGVSGHCVRSGMVDTASARSRSSISPEYSIVCQTRSRSEEH